MCDFLQSPLKVIHERALASLPKKQANTFILDKNHESRTFLLVNIKSVLLNGSLSVRHQQPSVSK